jgi:hypothetical protein
MPTIPINTILGTKAKLVDPKVATPAGNPRTPAPTMDLTRLKIMLGIEAPPVDGFALTGDEVATREVPATKRSALGKYFRLIVDAPPIGTAYLKGPGEEWKVDMLSCLCRP